MVATTVIEVGVNISEATIMVIEHAERFGLSQLHQLRGRVGRGADKSYCFLLYAGPLGETAKERLSIMRETEDGFLISEKDLEVTRRRRYSRHQTKRPARIQTRRTPRPTRRSLRQQEMMRACLLRKTPTLKPNVAKPCAHCFISLNVIRQFNIYGAARFEVKALDLLGSFHLPLRPQRSLEAFAQKCPRLEHTYLKNFQ